MLDANPRESLISDEAPLRPSYHPEEPSGRDDEIHQILQALGPLANRRTPQDVHVRGPPGVGKSTCIRYALEQLEDNGVRTIELDCTTRTTVTSVLRHILAREFKVPTQGMGRDQLLQKLISQMESKDGYAHSGVRAVAVVFDDFDLVDDLDMMLRLLKEAAAESDTPLAVVLVSSGEPGSVDLEPHVADRLQLRTVDMDMYDEETLTEILQRRDRKAFKSDVIDTRQVAEVASFVDENDLSCRAAIGILLRVARKAETAGEEEVRDEHLEAVFSQVRS